MNTTKDKEGKIFRRHCKMTRQKGARIYYSLQCSTGLTSFYVSYQGEYQGATYEEEAELGTIAVEMSYSGN